MKLSAEIVKTSNSNQDFLVTRIDSITERSWHDMPDISRKWVQGSDTVIFCKTHQQDIGFISFRIIGKNEVLILANMVDKQFQSRGISKFLVMEVIKELFLHPSKYKLNYFGNIYFAFRTPNPRTYEMVSFLKIFPSPKRQKPSDRELKIARKVMNIMSPTLELDEKTFVIRGVLKGHENLIYNKNNYPKARDENLNKFFENLLGYDGSKEDIVMVVGGLNVFKDSISLFRKLRRRRNA